MPSQTDIRLRVASVAWNNLSIWWTFDILLVDENKLSDDYLNAIWQIRKV